MKSPVYLLGFLLTVSLAGCQSGPLSGMALNPFHKPQRISYETPQVRMDAALAAGKKANGQDTAEQQQVVVELAKNIQTEPDPLVRREIVRAAAKFNTQLARQVLEAGLQDTNPLVRLACCQAIGQRGEATLAPALAGVVKQDTDLDVRIEAVRALGGIQSPEASSALVAALESDDPAMQFAGVESMKQATGQDFGGDVRAYLAYAKGETPPAASQPETSVASRPRKWLPF